MIVVFLIVATSAAAAISSTSYSIGFITIIIVYCVFEHFVQALRCLVALNQSGTRRSHHHLLPFVVIATNIGRFATLLPAER